MLLETLRKICEQEKLLYTNVKQLNKMKVTKKEVELAAKERESKLTDVADNIYYECKKIESSLERLKCFEMQSVDGHIAAFIWLGILTLVAQLVTMFFVVSVFDSDSVILSGIISTATYYLVMLWLRKGTAYKIMRCNIWSGTNIMLTVFLAINISVMCYFKHNGLAMSSAHTTIIFITAAAQAVYAIYFCKSKCEEYDEEYDKNARLIKDKETEWDNVHEKYLMAVADGVNYRVSAEDSLEAMQQDIHKQEQYIKVIENKLHDLYIQSRLHSKYQNWVAAATIYEYLSTGRCYELMGPNGAYNLYEKELIAKKILDSLESISHSTSYFAGSIMSSQSYIRRQLAECDEKISSMVVNKHGL